MEIICTDKKLLVISQPQIPDGVLIVNNKIRDGHIKL